jgi:hypothetical protein
LSAFFFCLFVIAGDRITKVRKLNGSFKLLTALCIVSISFSSLFYFQILTPSLAVRPIVDNANLVQTQDLGHIGVSYLGSDLHPNLKKYFVAIMRNNHDIQKDLLNLYLSYLGSDDIILSHPNERNLQHTMQLPGKHGVQYFSLAEIRSKAGSLNNLGVDIVSYDLEKDGSPPRDLRNPIASVKLASEIVRRYGMEFMVAPSHELTNLYGAQFAKYADVYDIQAQSLQSKPNEYKKFVEQVVNELRSSNPRISIIAQVSTDRGSLDSMKNCISFVAELVDGVTSWYSGDQKALDKLASFVAWFSDTYKK